MFHVLGIRSKGGKVRDSPVIKKGEEWGNAVGLFERFPNAVSGSELFDVRYL